MDFRKFPAHVEDLAKRCFEQPVSNEPFKVIGGRLGRMSGAAQVEMQSGLSAFVKPSNVNEQTVLGLAAEKIASDLAYLLKLPVAPVQLNNNGVQAGMNHVVAISYVALPGLAPWGQFAPNGSQLDVTRPILGAMWVFHAWINDSDHNWNDGNALLVFHEGEVKV